MGGATRELKDLLEIIPFPLCKAQRGRGVYSRSPSRLEPKTPASLVTPSWNYGLGSDHSKQSRSSAEDLQHTLY